ncbi:MAG: hypothetical protein NC094_11645 [Bacteroidales bacterium]|nr:hypothetical protein [Lachnoclostridium sp.]MCM1385094.1 hypothetical protein [Lachnoclostridium sp.]MCM1466061.1 hypothetical protein [Bacteroidales bacterium]
MGKRFYAVIILMLIFLLCGCADRRENHQEKSDTLAEVLQSVEVDGETEETVSGMEVSEEALAGTKESLGFGESTEGEKREIQETGDALWFIGKDANAGFGFTAAEYDYAFNFRGFYLSYDGKQDQIYIDPIEFVWPSETERWKEFGFSLDDPGTYASRNVKEELISIPLAEDIEFHICNVKNNPIVKELSDRHNEGEWVITRPEVFLYYAKSFSAPLTNWPFFMILDEEGNVKYVVEHPLVG